MEVVVADGLSGYGPGEVIGWTDGRLLVRRGRREWHLGPDASVDLSEDGEVIVADVADPDRFLRLRFGPATGATFTNRVGWLALVGTAVLAGAWLGDMRVLAAALVVAAISAVWSWRSNDESLQRQTFIDHAELVGHGSVTMGSGGDETWVPVLPLAGPVDRRSRRLEDVERFALGLAGFVVSAMAPYPFTGGGAGRGPERRRGHVPRSRDHPSPAPRARRPPRTGAPLRGVRHRTGVGPPHGHRAGALLVVPACRAMDRDGGGGDEEMTPRKVDPGDRATIDDGHAGPGW